MSDNEFDVLDELYFVTSYSELKRNTDLKEGELLEVLESLIEKSWVRVYENMDDELEEFDLHDNFQTYYYLASKKGLLAHNR